MANMLGSKGNGACKCCNDPLVPKRVNRKREKLAWQRDYEDEVSRGRMRDSVLVHEHAT